MLRSLGKVEIKGRSVRERCSLEDEARKGC
jgi:hypothetical protein